MINNRAIVQLNVTLIMMNIRWRCCYASQRYELFNLRSVDLIYAYVFIDTK